MSFFDPLTLRKMSMPEKFGIDVFFPRPRVDTLVTRLGTLDPNTGYANTNDPRINWEWNNRCVDTSVNYVTNGPISPWHIDEHYDPDGGQSNADQLAIVNSDFQAAVDLALKYLVTGDDLAAKASIRILDAWSVITSFDDNSGSKLNWNSKSPLLIQAAFMVRKHPSYTFALDQRLKTMFANSSFLSTAWDYTDNWAAWGVCFELAISTFLGDKDRFNRAILRWRTVFDYAVKANVPWQEVDRQGSGHGDGSLGLWYSNFFMYGMTTAAEWARYGGEWLYDYVGADGSTFKALYEKVRDWTRYPETFTYNTSGTPSTTVRILAHDDICYALWPSANGLWLLQNFPTGSVRDNYGMRQAVLCYRDRPLYG